MYYNNIVLIQEAFRKEGEMNRFLDVEKALEAVIYISQKTNDLFHIVKTLYYAYKFHLENYGRLIAGDFYIAMKDGPVPSGVYDLIKFVRGDGHPFDPQIAEAHPEKTIDVKNMKEITPLRGANLDYLSESDIECLDKAIDLYANMDMGQLWDLVHKEEAYIKAEKNKAMRFTDILLSIPNGKDVLEYLDS